MGLLAGTKEALYENVHIPERFEPRELTVDLGKVKEFAFAVDDYGPWYLGDSSPFGGPVGHPLILANDLLFLFYQNYDGNSARGLHTHEKLKFVSPVNVGERVVIEGEYSERYERRGQGYVVMNAVARGEDGRELVRHRGIEIMRTHAGSVVGGRRTERDAGQRRVLATFADGAQTVETASEGLAVRSPIPTLSKRISQAQMYVFSWGGRGYRNVHTSPEIASESGLDRTIVQAMQQTAFITESMVNFFGPNWLCGGELDLRYISPAYSGDTIAVRGSTLAEQTSSDSGRRLLELEVWTERRDGTKTAVGWATAPVAPLPETESPRQKLPRAGVRS